jgi:hypothetical protein
MGDKLEELERDIQEAKADLKRAREIGNVELELEIRRSLNFLFKEKERLTRDTERLGQSLHLRRLRKLSLPQYFST